MLRSTGVVGGMTMLSRVLGLARDVVFARLFGASLIMDAFFVAFKIPNLLRRFTAEGAFSNAFVPVISEYHSQRAHADVQDLVDRATGTLGLILVGITALGVIAAPIIIMIFAPGFIGESGRFDLATAMLRFTFPYLLFISLVALASGILNTYGRFAAPAFAPVLLNVVLISFALWVSPHVDPPGLALAIGVFVAGLIQLSFVLPFLKGIDVLPRPRWGGGHPGVRRIGRLMLPAIFGSSVAQINILIDTLIASFLITGSISWLYYSDRLMEFPLGVFGIALATVILPGLSRQHAQGSREAFSATLDWALRLVMLIALPAALGLFLLAGPMLATIFLGGAFDAHDVTMASVSLKAYALGLLGFSYVKVLAPGYFSRQDTRTPVRIGVIALVINMLLNVVFVVSLVKAGYEAPHAGLALATAITAFLNAFLLWRGLQRAEVYRPRPGWSRLMFKALVANAAMALFLVWARGDIERWLLAGLLDRVLGLLALVVAGAAIYFAALWLSGLRLKDLRVKPQ